jgi:mannosyltransferase
MSLANTTNTANNPVALDVTSSRTRTSLYLLLLGVAILRLWLFPLGSSLWLDETGTFWTISGGTSQILPRAIIQDTSPVYSAIAWVAVAIGGPHELVLRLPSTLAMGFATFLMYRLGARLFDRETGLLAALIFACFPGVWFLAADARPYGPAMCAFMAATVMLVRWFDSGRFRDATGYILFATLTVYLHYLFATTLLIHAVYAVQHWHTRGRIRVRSMVIAALVIGLLLVPLVPILHAYYAERAFHSYANMPYLGDLLGTIAPGPVAFDVLLALLIGRLICPTLKFSPPRMSQTVAVLLAACIALPPVLMYVASKLSGSSIFASRYYLPMTAGLTLLTGWGIRAVEPARARLTVAAVLTLAFISASGIRPIWISHADEDWRAAIQAVNVITSENAEMPVLFQGGFVEASNLDWLGDNGRRGMMLAPLTKYPATGKILLLPYTLNQKAEAYSERVVSTLLLEHPDRVLFVNRGVHFYEAWLQGRLRGAGFVSRALGNFGGVSVLLFERAKPTNAESATVCCLTSTLALAPER